MISTTTKKEQMEVFLILLFRAQDNPTPQLHKAKCYVPLIVMDSLSCSCFHVSKHKISQENNDISISYKNVSKYSKKQSYSPVTPIKFQASYGRIFGIHRQKYSTEEQEPTSNPSQKFLVDPYSFVGMCGKNRWKLNCKLQNIAPI